MRHGSLFSGIGGFDLAAEWMGWENVFQVEWDKWCQKVLAKNFPNALRFGDIVEFNKMLLDGTITTNTEGAGLIREKELEDNSQNNGTRGRCDSSNIHQISKQDGEIITYTKRNGNKRNTGAMAEKKIEAGEQNDGAEFDSISKNGLPTIGKIDIITGGFPCQPFSHAGKRKGANDSRYLWPEMLTTIRILKPTFVVGENVAGLVSMENGKTLDRILSDLENEGYQTEQIIIPACAVGAWHRRDRIWIIAYSLNSANRTDRGQGREAEGISCECGQTGHAWMLSGTGEEIYADTTTEGLQVGRHKPRQSEISQELRTEYSREDVPNSQEQRVQGIRRLRKQGTKEDAGQRLPLCCSDRNRANSAWWTTEPSVGRVANGIPRKLDRINGINYETIRKELFALWQKNDSTRMGKWGERFNIQEQEILQFSMLWLLDRINIENKENEWKENCSTKIQIDNMRTMWIEEIITEASQRWQYEKQHTGEHSNSLPRLPQGRTYQNQYLGSIWDEEPNTPRVASGIRDRVNRLKGLGNAIVPQVAYQIFKAIEQYNNLKP
jgi:DNA (cytosine-5)-methyltransferase 1